MDFDKSFEKLIGHEGGYSNHPRDPGGETKFGISRRSYPSEDIWNLTLERAKVIYFRDFWTAAGCDRVPEAIKFDLFDAAVNSGVGRAVMFLQGAIGVDQDGRLGPKTIAAAASMSPDRILMRFNATRLLFMASLPTWPSFGRGWASRIATNILTA
jgi:lysozyme family protein